MNTRKKSLYNIFYSILSYLITLAFGLILPRLVVVTYGSEVNGLIHSVSQLLVYLGLFEAGVGAAAEQALFGPMARQDWQAISSIMAATGKYYRKTGHFYLAGLILVSLCYPFLVDSSLSFPTVFGVAFFSGIGRVVVFYLQGKYNILLRIDGKGYVLTNISTIITILTNLAKILLLNLGLNVVTVLAVSFFLHCIPAFYILWYVRSYPKLDMSAPPNYTAIAQKGFALGHQISGLIFNNTDVLILTAFCGLKVVSVYSIYKLITSQLENILGLFSNSMTFVLGQNFHTDRALYIRRSDVLQSCHSAILFALFSVALFLLSPFMRLYTAGLTDANYLDPWLPLLFVSISLLSQMRMPTLLTINIAGHFGKTLPQSIFESAINIVVSLVSVYFLGVYGVLIGTIVALLYRTNDIIIYANRRILNRSAWKTYAIQSTGLAFFCLSLGIFHSLFDPITINSYGYFIFAGVVCTLIAFTLQIVGQLVAFENCRNTAKDICCRVWAKHAK